MELVRSLSRGNRNHLRMGAKDAGMLGGEAMSADNPDVPMPFLLVLGLLLANTKRKETVLDAVPTWCSQRRD